MDARQRQNRNRKIIQMFFGSKFFSLPHIYKLRIWVYSKIFKLGKGARITEGVEFQRQHALMGKLDVAENVLFSRGTWIDYTGGVTIEKNVAISARSMIFSHSHDPLDIQSKKTKLTPLHIAEGAWLCVGSMIMPGVGYIGKHSVISPGSVVYKKVPDYAIVRGNPAKIMAVIPPKIRNAER